MFRTTTLTTLSVLALFGCITTPASAQYLNGNVQGGFAHSHSYGHLDHGQRYDYGHGNYHGYGHTTYPTTTLSRLPAISVNTSATCSYGNDTIRSAPIGCQLQSGRTYPNSLTNDYQPRSGDSRNIHSHTGDSHIGHLHEGHFHEGHSHQGHSYDRQIPSRGAVPSDREYLAPRSLPRDSVRDLQPQQDFRREQPQPDDSIRMDGPPPASFSSEPLAVPSGSPQLRSPSI